MYSEKGIYRAAPYFNRELSQLEFHKRVLKQAEDESIPLLERQRFLCISSTNPDEFFEVRVAGLMQKLEAGVTQTDDDHEILCGSADWMERNLFSRVEVVFPILDPRLRDKVYKEGLAPYLADNTRPWQLQSDGSYKRNKPGNARPRNTQRLQLEKLSKPCPCQ